MAADTLVTFGDTRLSHRLRGEPQAVHGRRARRASCRRRRGRALPGAAACAGGAAGGGAALGSKDADLPHLPRCCIRCSRSPSSCRPRKTSTIPTSRAQFTMLLANASGIFGIYSYREVFEFKQFWSIGSGRSFALGAMHAAYDKAPARRARSRRPALRAGCEFDRNSARPIDVLTLKLKVSNMSELIEVKVPDIGDFKDVAVIEVLVKPGDTVEGRAVADHGRESDKASMEIPSSHAGVVKALKVKVGDKVSEGSVILRWTRRAGAAAAGAAHRRRRLRRPPRRAAPAAGAARARRRPRLGSYAGSGRPRVRHAGARRRPRRLLGRLPRRRPRHEDRCWSSATRRSAASASTSAASRRRRCCTSPR